MVAKKQIIVGLFITCIAASLALFSTGSIANLINRIDGILYDSRLQMTLPTAARVFDESVVIIDIDEKSMQEQGRFPWSRSKIAQLIDELTHAGVIVIAFDIFFAESEISPVETILAHAADLSPEDASTLVKLGAEIDADKQFATALANNDTVLGFLLSDDKQSFKGQVTRSSLLWPDNEKVNSQVGHFSGVIANIPQLQQAAAGSGFINAHSDKDGFIRKAALVNRVNDKLYPSLALEAARLYTLSDNIETRSKVLDGITLFEGIKFQNKWIQTDEYGQILIPYKGKAKSFNYFSATDVLTKKVGAKQLAGSVAFIGTSAIGLADLRATPVGLQYPGVEVHANIFEGLMHPEILPSTPSWVLAANLLIILLIGFTLSLLSYKKSARFISFVALITALIFIAANFYLWAFQKISLPLFIPLLLISVLAGYNIFISSIAELEHSRKIKSMFDQYVPPEHINKLINQENSLTPHSERKNMTVLFSDIRGFTSLSESMPPHQLSEYLNQYLTAITKIIFSHNGTIDKYVGDMVMAFWNAPLADEKHAQHAVETAIAMVKALPEINKLFSEKDLPAIKIGVGISTGLMNVGDMGSIYRKAYTVLGDTVNLGSRVESLTKFYGVSILVTDETMRACAHITFRFIDKVQVIGKKTAIKLFEPIDYNTALTASQITEITKSSDAMNHYYNKNWQQALKLFKELEATSTLSSNVYTIFIERIKATDLVTLDKDWNGAFIHTKK
ncbi:adenylate/guanylate cyclase domain-containing protein [Pseudoalteromonas sp. MMG010]|uniref:CHASE2 domain-containing protein n=1 Tax=Pseudoalteromonas sp. MMG010 TaxID=2822685 RepID=UPI001B3A71F2|nr:adenylate/guanylate cyclase domain-containing protein [Pseudoalteromonas sp. MMG010]MBQ4834673.1 adenylate/guanylate cyclase domain-containing protein [Pseudoalteromonas sp. MMG010]